MHKLATISLATLIMTSAIAARPQDKRQEQAFANTYASNWPSWRGPLGSGEAQSGSPPTNWAEATEDTPARNIAWKTKVEGLGISSPIVWQSRIYMTTAIATDRPGVADADIIPQDHRAVPRPTVIYEFAVIAINRKDGSIAWQKKLTEAVPHEGGHRTNSHASSSPVTDGQHIYASFGSHGVYCLNFEGDVIWAKMMGTMSTRRQYGEGSSPALHGDQLIINWDHEGESFLAVLDKRTGKELWRQPRNEVTSWSTPIVAEVDGRTQVIVNATSASRGYDLHTGKVIWSLAGMTVNCIPIPIHEKGIVYLMSGYRGKMLQAVSLAGATGDLTGSKNLLWQHTRSTSYVPSAALHDQRLYFVRGNTAVLSCLDAMSGEVLYEGQRLPGLREVYASPVCADGRIYLTSREGVTIVIKSGSSFEQLAVNRIDDEVDASSAIIGDSIYMRGRQYMYCIAKDAEPKTGQPSPKTKTTAGSVNRLSYRRIGSLGDGSERTASLSIGDIDGDDDLDVVVANGRHWAGQNKIFLNDLKNGGSGTFSTQHNLGAEQSTSYTAALDDIDGDGDLDAVVGNDKKPSYIMLNDGTGKFVRGARVGPISNTRSVTLADLDGKDGVDVIFTNRREENLICFNDGRGGFTRTTTFGDKSDATINVAAADLDSDGDLDLAVANREGQQNRVYINDGTGDFKQSAIYGTGTDMTRGVAIADVDGDGHLDIINANIGHPNAIYYGDGALRFDRSRPFGKDAKSYAVLAADLNCDGLLDIAVANVKEPNAVYLQRDDHTFDRIPFGTAAGITYGLVAGDWNGDGLPEIATANSDGRNWLYQLQSR